MQQWNILQLVRGGIYILHESNFHSPTSHMLLHSSRLMVHGGRGTHLPEEETHATDWDHPYYSKHNQGQCGVHLGPKSNISEVVSPGYILGNCGNCPFTSKIKVQILLTIHIGNVWVMLWELIATSAIVWAKYKMPCSPLCASYLWVEFEGRTFTLITFRSERVRQLRLWTKCPTM